MHHVVKEFISENYEKNTSFKVRFIEKRTTFLFIYFLC